MNIQQIDLQINLDVSPICLGCFQVFNTEIEVFNHTIRCDDYYHLDNTNQEIHDYCFIRSINGKVILINRELGIDFNYVKKNKYSCRHIDTEKYVNSTLKMNPNMEQIYSDKVNIILSDCISKEEITFIYKNIEK